MIWSSERTFLIYSDYFQVNERKDQFQSSSAQIWKKRTANWKVDHNRKMDFKYNTQTVYFLITNETEPITTTTTTTKKKAHTNSGKKMSKKCVGSGPLVLTLCMTFLRSCWIPKWVLTPLKFKWSLSLRAHVNSK